MIEITKKDIDKTKYDINPDRILRIEDGPGDTANIKMTNGDQFSVQETRSQIKRLIREYKVEILKEAMSLALKEVNQNGR